MPDQTYGPKIYKKANGDTMVVASGGEIQVESGGLVTDAVNPIVHNLRTRLTIAQVNAGVTLLAAIAGKSYRLTGCDAIAYGGAVGAVTTVDVKGVQATSTVKLVAFAQASLTQSAVLKMGGSGAAVLADGASHTACDVNTAITLAITGSNVTTATGIDIILSYTIE